ncbi:MAG: hypothetical protein KF829_02500 [Ferruginibacter sp.]|nr:hypothetical protein [Ferruginibacter sp.]
MKKFLFLSLLFVFTTSLVFAQPTKKAIRPKISTLLGQYKDSIALPIDEVKNIIVLPLRCVDDQRVVYTIASYQLSYLRNAIVEDESGKISPTTSLASQRFTETPIPHYWLKPMIEQFDKGETITFFDIIVKDPSGKVFYAQDLKIKLL